MDAPLDPEIPGFCPWGPWGTYFHHLELIIDPQERILGHIISFFMMELYVCGCVYAYMHICIYAYMHIYIYAYMHLCRYTYMHIYIHTYIHICIYTYIYIYRYIPGPLDSRILPPFYFDDLELIIDPQERILGHIISFFVMELYVCGCVYAYTCMHICIYAYMYTYMHIYIYADIHICRYTYMHIYIHIYIYAYIRIYIYIYTYLDP